MKKIFVGAAAAVVAAAVAVNIPDIRRYLKMRNM
ncbi:DUF6893 family small protein [Streptantibioticus silvisoli]